MLYLNEYISVYFTNCLALPCPSALTISFLFFFVQSTRHLFTPADRRIPRIRIETRQASTLAGQRIMVAIDGWPKHSRYPNVSWNLVRLSNLWNLDSLHLHLPKFDTIELSMFSIYMKPHFSSMTRNNMHKKQSLSMEIHLFFFVRVTLCAVWEMQGRRTRSRRCCCWSMTSPTRTFLRPCSVSFPRCRGPSHQR